jgi:uncharacterized protein (DUF1800 family)
MAAMVAAIFLDREARADILDWDRSHGKLREPLLKVIGTMRSLEFKPRSGREVALRSMRSRILQQVYGSPTTQLLNDG